MARKQHDQPSRRAEHHVEAPFAQRGHRRGAGPALGAALRQRAARAVARQPGPLAHVEGSDVDAARQGAGDDGRRAVEGHVLELGARRLLQRQDQQVVVGADPAVPTEMRPGLRRAAATRSAAPRRGLSARTHNPQGSSMTLPRKVKSCTR